MTLGFDLHTSAVADPTPRAIQVGDTVRCRASRLKLYVIDLDGEDVYCEGFIDPFSASGLKIVG